MRNFQFFHLRTSFSGSSLVTFYELYTLLGQIVKNSCEQNLGFRLQNRNNHIQFFQILHLLNSSQVLSSTWTKIEKRIKLFAI